MASIVTLTMNPAIDRSLEVDRVEPEIKLRCDPPHSDPGGGGINVSRAILELGGDSLAVYPSGGLTGEMLGRLLDESGLDRRQIPIEAETRENVCVMEREGGRQFRFNTPGARLTEEEQERCLEILRRHLTSADVLVISGSLPGGVAPEFSAGVVEMARERSIRVIADSSGEALRSVAAAGVFLLKPNVRELRELTGEEVEGSGEIVGAARGLIERGSCEIVVVSMGREGAYLVSGEERLFGSAPETVVRSRIGAGDSMVGAMAMALVEGRPLREVLARGVAAGGAAVMTPGTRLLRRADWERLLEGCEVREVDEAG